jgi:hypothetical protein
MKHYHHSTAQSRMVNLDVLCQPLAISKVAKNPNKILVIGFLKSINI